MGVRAFQRPYSPFSDSHMFRSFIRSAAALCALSAIVACGSDDTVAPINTSTGTITVDASQAFAYIRLGEEAQIVNVSDPSASTAWDLGFLATTVTANGGSAGPGDVTIHCLCANAGATTAEIQGFTADNQLAAFDAVTAAQIPAESQFRGDSLSPAISGWFTGSGAQATANTSRSWIVRRGSATVTLGKLRVTSLQNVSAQNAGVIAFEYAVQPTPDAPFGQVVQASVDVRNGPVYFDLTSGTTSSASGAWDLRFSGFEIRSNGGVSGSGNVMAVPDNNTPFASIDAAYAGTAPVVAYKRDAYSGVFNSQPWYQYNITGTDNQIWPLFNVYLVKRGSEVYKVQLTSYYSTAGTSRQITVRYARLQ
jgi:hypothetical protein